MTLEKLLGLPKLISTIKEFKNKHRFVWDIAIYGSFIRGDDSAGDLDFAIIFKIPMKLDEKLKLSQQLRHSLSKFLNYNIDVVGVEFNDFIDPNFMARQGIIGEGYLVLHKKMVAELLGFKAYAIFTYKLEGLTNSKKTMFRYAMIGRRGQKGIFAQKNCQKLGKGAIKVPIEHSEEFKEFLEGFKIKYKMEKVLSYH